MNGSSLLLKKITALIGDKILLDFVFLIWDIPTYLLSNIQTHFTGRVIHELLRYITAFITPNFS